MVAYNNCKKAEGEKIKIKYVDASDIEKGEQDAFQWLSYVGNDEVVSGLTEAQQNRLARLAANTRPDTMRPESMANFEQMKAICEQINSSNYFVRKLLRWSIKNMLKKSVPTSLTRNEKEEMIRKTLKLYTDKDELCTLYG